MQNAGNHFSNLLVFWLSCFPIFLFSGCPVFQSSCFLAILFSNLLVFWLSCFPISLFSGSPVFQSCFLALLFYCVQLAAYNNIRDRLFLLFNFAFIGIFVKMHISNLKNWKLWSPGGFRGPVLLTIFVYSRLSGHFAAIFHFTCQHFLLHTL